MEELVCWNLCWGVRWEERRFTEAFGRGSVEDVSGSRALSRWEKGRRAAMVAN